MMFHIGFLLILAGTSLCLPQRFTFPVVDVSPPEEVNSLESFIQDQPATPRPSRKLNTVEETIKEVENIIKANPSLPRLTRGEILDLLENITSEEKLNSINYRDPKAIMVVMPYTPGNTDDKSIQDLYTKPPVTQIIGEPTKEETKQKTKNRRRPGVKFTDTLNKNIDETIKSSTEPSTFSSKKHATTSRQDIDPPKFQEKIPTTTKISVRRRRPTTTTSTTTTPEPTTQYPEVSTYRRRRPYPTPTTTTTSSSLEVSTYHPRRPLRRRTTTTTTTTASPVYHPNHKYPEEDDESSLPSDGIRIVDPPSSQKFNNDLVFNENTKQEVVLQQKFPVDIPPPKPEEPVADSFNIPENYRHVVQDLNLDAALIENDKPKISIDDQNRIKELLASIGAVTTTTTTTTTTTAVPDVDYVAESLSPDMRELLMSFGLIPNPKEKPTPSSNLDYFPEKAEVKPESYVGFKPLPEDPSTRDDMEQLLASFGLGRNSRRNKALKNTEKPEYNLDVVPDNLKEILRDIGLETLKQQKKLPPPPPPPKQHVFNPDSEYVSEEELKKLDKLLGTIRTLEKLNGTANEEDLKQLDLESLKELVSSLNSYNESVVPLDEQKNVPDPLDFDTSVSKNEVKRQQSTTTEVSASISIVTPTVTEEPKNPSLADLEASFGGNVGTTVTEPPAIETTTKKFTGFYYLLDWNTFLDIDDQKGKRVNLRFQPKAGDPNRFLSVSVP